VDGDGAGRRNRFPAETNRRSRRNWPVYVRRPGANSQTCGDSWNNMAMAPLPTIAFRCTVQVPLATNRTTGSPRNWRSRPESHRRVGSHRSDLTQAPQDVQPGEPGAESIREGESQLRNEAEQKRWSQARSCAGRRHLDADPRRVVHQPARCGRSVRPASSVKYQPVARTQPALPTQTWVAWPTLRTRRKCEGRPWRRTRRRRWPRTGLNIEQPAVRAAQVRGGDGFVP